MSVVSYFWLTILRREGVICSVETQDGYCCIGQFFVWTGIMVIVRACFVTKSQRGKAFVKLTDCPGLQERDEMKWKWRKDKAREEMKSNYDRNMDVKNGPYLQDIVNVHHFLQNLPVSVRNRFFFFFQTELKIVKLNWGISKTATYLTWSQRDTSR